MKLEKATQDWIKSNQAILKRLVELRTQDYLNQVVDEEDEKRKAVLSLFVKELRMISRLIDNVIAKKDMKKPEEKFTGM